MTFMQGINKGQKQIAKNLKKIIATIVETLFATFICAIGVCLFVEAGLGSDTIDVFIEGIHKFFNVSLGQADFIVSMLFLILAFILNRKKIGWPSILYSVLIGFVIDFVNIGITSLALAEQSIIVRFLCIVIAQLCFGFFYAIFQTIQKGMNTVDAVIYFFIEKFHLSYVKSRTMLDVICFIVGYSLGGVVGVGTILSVFTTGLTTAFIVKKVKHMKENTQWYAQLYEVTQ